MKVDEFITTEAVKYHKGGLSNERTLPAYSFVKPINIRWVPQHVLDDVDGKWFTPSKEIFCYCSGGIIVIQKDKIRKV